MIIAIDNLKADRNKRLFFTEQQEQREQLTSRSKFGHFSRSVLQNLNL